MHIRARSSLLSLRGVRTALQAVAGIAAWATPAAGQSGYAALEFNGDAILLLEPASVSRNGDIVSATLITMPANERAHRGKPVYLINGSAEVDCRASRIRYARISFRGPSQELVGADNTPRAWTTVPDEGPARNFLRFACQGDAEATAPLKGSLREIYATYQRMLLSGQVR